MTTCINCGKEILDNLILNCTCGKEFCSGRCLRLWHDENNSPHGTKLGNSVSKSTPDNSTKLADTNTQVCEESLSGDWWDEREKKLNKGLVIVTNSYKENILNRIEELKSCKQQHEKEMAEQEQIIDNLIEAKYKGMIKVEDVFEIINKLEVKPTSDQNMGWYNCLEQIKRDLKNKENSK